MQGVVLMSQLLYEDEHFKIVKAHDYVVIRKNHPYEFHSHFHKYGGARSLIKLFYRKVQPEDDYFHTAMKRITTEVEFNRFSPQRRKQQYYNVNKGRRK